MIGMLAIEYVRQNWLQPMSEMYDVTYVCVSVLNRVMTKAQVTEYLLKALDSDKYDYLFAYPDGCHQMFSDVFFQEAKKRLPVISFYSDDEPDKWMKNNLKYDYRSDLIVTHSARAYDYRKQAGYGRGLMRVQWGYNPKYFYKTNEEKDTDVIFMGSNFYRCGMYIYDGKLRQKILTEAYSYCKDNGYSFKIYGSKWDKHPVLKEAWGGFVSDKDIVHVINKAKIVIGLGYTQDKKPTFHTKLKHFEIAGCGSLELVNKNPDLYSIFGNSMPQFRTAKELCDKIGYYLEHEEEREELALNAYNICRNSCTMKDRIAQILDYADKCFYKNSIDVTSGCKTDDCRVVVKSFVQKKKDVDYKDIFEYLKKPETGVTHIQILDSNTRQLDFNKTLARGEIRPGETYLCDSLFSLSNNSGYDISKEQRRCLDDNAWLVKKGIAPNSVWYDFSRDNLSGFERNGRFFPLSGYLFDINSAGKYLTDYLDGNYKRFEGVNYSEWILNDIRIISDDEKYKNREARAVREFLEKCTSEKLVIIWGAYGDLTQQVLKALWEADTQCSVAFADKNSDQPYIDLKHSDNYDKSKQSYKVPIINSAEILDGNHVHPYAVIITAVYSGESMRNMLKERNKDCFILPLYDLDDDIWKKEGIMV